jgi:serine/threonine protein kinase
MSVAEPQDLLAGRYRLRSVLGRGGMGTVWLAGDELLGRDVAVKEICWPPELSTAEREVLRQRALREARMAARLNHPNVVGVYDIVQEDSRPWIVMQLVPYRSLSEIVREDGPLSPGRAARVGLRTLEALRAAHETGVLHRDVKPGNVLLGPDGRVVLTDFGIAIADGSPTMTTAGNLIGSPCYMAPERARGERASPAADLWSLGATLYTAVEGRPPFDREGAMATLTAIVTEDPEPASRAGPLWPVISGLLRKDPGERLSAAAAVSLLRRIADDKAAAQEAAAQEASPEVPESGTGFDEAAAGQLITSRRGTARTPMATAELESAVPQAEGADLGQSEDPVPESRVPESPGLASASESRTPLTSAPEPAEPPESSQSPEPAERPEPDARAAAPPDQAAAGQHWKGSSRRRLAAFAGLGTLAVAAATFGAVLMTASPEHRTASQPHATPKASAHRTAPQAAGTTTPRTGPSSTGSAAPPGNPGGSGALPAGFAWYQDPTGFSIGVPSGWAVSHEGNYVYVRDPGGGRFLLIDQSSQPKTDPLADWRQQEANRIGTYPGYQRVRLQAVHYAQAEKAADWEFIYNENGQPVHVLNRNVLANASHAYALYWSTPKSEWDASFGLFQAFADTFQPAAAAKGG